MTTLLDHLDSRPRRPTGTTTTPAQRLRATMAAVPGLVHLARASRRP